MFDGNTIFCYWEGPMPPYIQLCAELLRAHNHNVVLLDPPGLQQLGFPSHVWATISRWNVVQRSDAIRCWLLHRFGGMWCDIDCIPMQPFWPVLHVAKATPLGVAAYHSTDDTVGVGFIAARRDSPVIERWWQAIVTVIQEDREPGWLEVSSEPFTRIVREAGLENVPLWPLAHISPVPWNESERLLVEAPSSEHHDFMRGFPAAWCWMLSNQVLRSHGLPNWSRHQCLNSRTLLSEVFRESMRRVAPPPVRPKGKAVAVLNVHNDGLPHNFRESMRHAADRWGADFVEIRNPIVPWFDVWWEKLNLDRHLYMYERVVFFDRDVVVSQRCPNLFEVVPVHCFGVVPSEQEGHSFLPAIRDYMDPLCKLLNVEMDYTNDYFNSGVMIFSPPRHRVVFELARALHPMVKRGGWITTDQGLISLALKALNISIHRLPPTFNRVGQKLWERWQPEMDDYIWHFCGPKNWERMAQTKWQV